MRQGRDLEIYVAERFVEATNLNDRRANAMYAQDRYPFIFAYVDRVIVGFNIGLECRITNILNTEYHEPSDEKNNPVV